MKNVLKILGIIVMAAVIGFPMVSCDDDIIDIIGGLVTLSGLDDYNGKFVVAFGSNKDGSLQLVAAYSRNNQSETGARINDGKAILTVWEIGGTEENPTFSAYKGSDIVKFAVGIFDNAVVNNDSNNSGEGWALSKFTNGAGAGYFYSFDIDFPDGGGSQNSGKSFNITVPSALGGTWKGDDSNGTLAFNTTSISTTDLFTTKAYAFIAAIENVSKTSTLTISADGNGSGKISKVVSPVSINLYIWTITGTTLTITDTVKNSVAFTGTKQ